jgi:O-antigen/teichoic acid export membrane protein
MSEGMRRNVVRAIGSSTVISIGSKLLSLGATLVLVRLLSPADFGLVAIATTITGVIGFFNEIGLGSAIVQRQGVSGDEVNGCFGIALIASTLLCAVTAALAWPMAHYYAMPELRDVLLVLAACLYFGALNTVPLALLRKNLRFQPVLWCGALTVVVQACVAIPLAASGARHWAIVIGFVVGQSAGTLWYWLASGWRPAWPMDLGKGRELMGYGLNITATRVLWHLYMNADKLIIGKMLGAHAVGVYDVARSLANLPTSQISGVATNIASPVYARLQADLPRLRESMLRLVRGVAYLTFPVLCGMAVLAAPLIATLLGPTWVDAVWPLRALCVAELVASVANLQTQLLISSGHVGRLVRYNMICALVLPAALAGGAWAGGLMGVALVWAGVYPVVYLWLLREVLRVTALSWRGFAASLARPATGTAFMCAWLITAQPLLVQLQQAGMQLVAGIVLGALAYMAFVIYLDRAGLAEIRHVLIDLGVPAQKLAHWPFARLDGLEGSRASD